MPGPKHATPRHPGPRPDPEGNPRVPNKKAEARLIRRTAAAPLGAGFRMPGSQNRNKG